MNVVASIGLTMAAEAIINSSVLEVMGRNPLQFVFDTALAIIFSGLLLIVTRRDFLVVTGVVSSVPGAEIVRIKAGFISA